MKKIELLSPVGGYEQFIAAVECGADAVYLGGSSFNARNSAANFSDEELKNVIAVAHIRGVKVHLTLNTLIHDSEINDVINFAERAYSFGVDAFIVQDLGVIKLLREVLPEVTLHLSTQGTIYSAEGIAALDDLDFERIVLSRELSLQEIQKVCEKTDKDIEVFVHGALCVCYSGQCRLSSLIGERSGNRGKCAQPCRLKYTILKEDEKCVTGYCMSPKDLCGIHDLIDLIKSGVTSLKIEGRLKSPEYVACVTSIYRKYIDIAYELIESGREDDFKVDKDDIWKLEQVFNRGGFSNGYYRGKLGRDLICRERPKHWGTFLGEVLDYRKKLVKIRLAEDLSMGDGIEVVNDSLPGNIVTYIKKDNEQVKCGTVGEIVEIGDISGDIKKGEKVYKISDKLLNSELKKYTNGKYYRKLSVDIRFWCAVGEKSKATVLDGENEITVENDFIVQEAINKPLTREFAFNAFAKLGDTPFSLRNFDAEIVGSCLVPMSVLNELRRQLAERLEEKRALVNRSFTDTEPRDIDITSKKIESKISVYLYDTKKLDGLELADRVYIPIEKYSDEILEKLKNKEIIPYLSTVTKGEEYECRGDKVLVGNPEHLELMKNVENIYADFSFNVFNSYACEYLAGKGVKGVNLSFELNLEEIKKINTNIETEVTVYGRLPLMVSEHCPIGSEIGGNVHCGLGSKSQYYLEDRMGVKFPIVTDCMNCRITLLNGKVLFAPEAVEEIKGRIDYFRCYFFDESTEERRRILGVLKNGKRLENLNGYTSGHFYRGV